MATRRPLRRGSEGRPLRAADRRRRRHRGDLLQNIDRENAFGDTDVRLLTTLAGSLSVALENARLFDQTKRLLGETEQRNAELAVVNEIGAALARQLDFQAIIDAVGDRVGADPRLG